MSLSRLLSIPRGLTAIIGSGGKTTAMYTLARELSALGTVICATSTTLYPCSKNCSAWLIRTVLMNSKRLPPVCFLYTEDR